MNKLIPKTEVAKIWTLPGKKAPCDATIWRYTREGKIPQPRLIGRTNLYPLDEVVRLRNQAWGISD